MRRTLIFCLAMLVLLPAATCDDAVTNARKKDDLEKDPNPVAYIADLGIIDGCHVKWVVMKRLPDFYLVRCGDGKQAETFYETGGKTKTRVGAVIEEKK